MEFLIISGLSGAGKSRTADILEDLDFYCVDNMPVALMPPFAELCQATGGRYERVALVTDIRERESFNELFAALDSLWEMDFSYRILYVEADVPTIVQRYKETRRRHPLAQEGSSIEAAVKREMALLSGVRERADYILNTTGLTLGQLQSEIYKLFVGDDAKRPLKVSVTAFGFKYGIPLEADLVFDVRFLPNPFYVADLRNKTGLDKEVQNFIFSYREAREFRALLEEMVDFLMPLYVEEGKYSLTIAVGCTGGHHRSVAVAESLTRHIEERGQSASLVCRDLDKSV